MRLQLAASVKPMINKLHGIRRRQHVPDTVTSNDDTPVNRAVKMMNGDVRFW